MLRARGSVQVTHLSEVFGVSMQTIRKDLAYLEDHGIATRAYGGAISSEVVNAGVEPAIETKRVSHTEEKERDRQAGGRHESSRATRSCWIRAPRRCRSPASCPTRKTSPSSPTTLMS
ncbi:DeoR family transcriptional regulator [Caulobacter segnis]